MLPPHEACHCSILNKAQLFLYLHVLIIPQLGISSPNIINFHAWISNFAQFLIITGVIAQLLIQVGEIDTGHNKGRCTDLHGRHVDGTVGDSDEERE